MFPNEFSTLPNLHVNVHLSRHARNYATLVNTAVAVKEMVHRIHKGRVSRLNRKVVELDLTRRENTDETIRHLINGWKDTRFPAIQNNFCRLANDFSLYRILTREQIANLYSNTQIVEKNMTDTSK